ncbi:MAG: roadblock/LC7 domain-containing protein [Myxococcota bacterium]
MHQAPAQRHWLAGQLDELDALARDRDHRAREASQGHGDEAVARTARDEFLRAIDRFVTAVSQREHVLACVVGHEGLVLATGGDLADAETLAAVSQVWLASAQTGAEQVKLGPLTQMVVIGAAFKVALFQAGGMSIAILAPTGADLASSLAGP